MQSTTVPGKTYTLRRIEHGGWECTCPGYRRTRPCKHVLHQIGAVVASDQLGAVKVCLSCEGDLRGELVWCKACERKMETLYSQMERS